MNKKIDVVVPSLYCMFNAEQEKLKSAILQAIASFEGVTGAHVSKMEYAGVFVPMSDASKDALDITYKIR